MSHRFTTLLRDGADRAWAVLAIATGATLWLGERGGALGPLAAGAVLALAVLKGWLVIDEFMGLKHAPPLWRRLLLGWLLGVCALIGVLHATAG